VLFIECWLMSLCAQQWVDISIRVVIETLLVLILSLFFSAVPLPLLHLPGKRL
jgi:hypothetical protein